MDLTITCSFDVFFGYFFLDVILYLVVLLLQPVCKVGFIPSKVLILSIKKPNVIFKALTITESLKIMLSKCNQYSPEPCFQKKLDKLE